MCVCGVCVYFKQQLEQVFRGCGKIDAARFRSVARGDTKMPRFVAAMSGTGYCCLAAAVVVLSLLLSMLFFRDPLLFHILGSVFVNILKP